MLTNYQESVEDLMNEIIWEDVLEVSESYEMDSAQNKSIENPQTRTNIKEESQIKNLINHSKRQD